jgi:hypothetical protein
VSIKGMSNSESSSGEGIISGLCGVSENTVYVCEGM